MKIRKVAVGNAAEAFIEGNFTNGVNIISSDDNNKGKTIVIQSMMYALGNEPTFPTSFEFQKYYYYIEFEEAGIIFKLCRSGDGFVLKRESTVLIFDNVSELKRYWNRNIFPLPSIAKNQLLRIVDPVLYVQLFFIGQDKKDTSNIANHGFYNKQDFIDMLYAYAGLIGEQLPQERIDEIKSHIITLSDEKKLLLQQHKILKSKKTPVSYLSAESDRLAFGKKIESLERVQNKIAELRKARNSVSTRKSKWEHTINELRSLNRTISCGELRCMDCNSTNISFSTGESVQTSYSFDVSTVEASNQVPTPLLGHRCRSSQEITGSPTPFSTSNHYLWICASASFSLSNPNIAAYATMNARTTAANTIYHTTAIPLMEQYAKKAPSVSTSETIIARAFVGSLSQVTFLSTCTTMFVSTTSTPMMLMMTDQFSTLSIFFSSCYPAPSSGGVEFPLSGHELFLLRFSNSALRP